MVFICYYRKRAPIEIWTARTPHEAQQRAAELWNLTPRQRLNIGVHLIQGGIGMRLDTRPLETALYSTGTLTAPQTRALLDELHATRGEIDRALVWHERGQSSAAMNYLARFMKGESA